MLVRICVHHEDGPTCVKMPVTQRQAHFLVELREALDRETDSCCSVFSVQQQSHINFAEWEDLY